MLHQLDLNFIIKHYIMYIYLTVLETVTLNTMHLPDPLVSRL